MTPTYRSGHPVELLAPAGNLEKLEIAIRYGADAAYLGGKGFSLRNFSGNFTDSELEDAIAMAHDQGVKVYVALNVYARSPELPELERYLSTLGRLAPDALIISDPGILMTAREKVPELPIHLSTQSNTTNVASARFWKTHGVTRINAARELSMEEIRILAHESGVEVECFVHGAMCMSYSGRCLLSNYLTGRDSNRGSCAHPCRWNYHVVEKTRPGQYMPILEDERGTYIFNSRDLCMIEHLPELMDAGAHSLKIEGRMKGIHYLAVAVGTYREAIDRYFEDPEGYTFDPEWRTRLEGLSNRCYTTGFYHEIPEADRTNTTADIHQDQALFVGKTTAEPDGFTHPVHARNKFGADARLEALVPGTAPVKVRVRAISDPNGNPLEHAQPNLEVMVELDRKLPPFSLLRILS